MCENLNMINLRYNEILNYNNKKIQLIKQYRTMFSICIYWPEFKRVSNTKYLCDTIKLNNN